MLELYGVGYCSTHFLRAEISGTTIELSAVSKRYGHSSVGTAQLRDDGKLDGDIKTSMGRSDRFEPSTLTGTWNGERLEGTTTNRNCKGEWWLTRSGVGSTQ